MIVIRPATECDVSTLIEIARRSWLGAYELCAPAAFVRDWLAREFEREWYPAHWHEMFVAGDESVLLGLVQPTADEINGLWVDPPAQGRGVGSALLAHGESQIVAIGYERAWLSCSGYNANAQRFYVARGYSPFRSEIRERDGGVQEEMCYYERALPRLSEG